jgi:hypothetical protein
VRNGAGVGGAPGMPPPAKATAVMRVCMSAAYANDNDEDVDEDDEGESGAPSAPRAPFAFSAASSNAPVNSLQYARIARVSGAEELATM